MAPDPIARDPADVTASLWDATAPAEPRFTSLAGTVTADVAIIGGGITGLSAALTLAELGVAVVVLEAASVGTGAVGRSCGLVNAGMWVPPEQIRRTLGPIHGDRLLDLLGQAPQQVFGLIAKHGIDCDPAPLGTLQCAVDKAGMTAIAAREKSWRKIGADVVLLDATETARRVGTTRFVGALLDRRTGTVQPLAYARGLARAAASAGATIFDHSPVTGFERRDDKWMCRTATGELLARQLLVATDTYSRTNDFNIKSEFVDLPYFNVATEPLGAERLAQVLPSGQAVTDTRKVLSSYRLDRDGRLIIGSVGSLSTPGSAAHKDWAVRAMARLFPALGDVRLEHAWWGRIGMTGSHLPAIHALGPGAIAVGGYNGRGIAAGTVFGEAVAHHLAGRTSAAALPVPMTPLRPARLAKLKGCFYELAAQGAHLVGARR